MNSLLSTLIPLSLPSTDILNIIPNTHIHIYTIYSFFLHDNILNSLTFTLLFSLNTVSWSSFLSTKSSLFFVFLQLDVIPFYRHTITYLTNTLLMGFWDISNHLLL